MSVVGVKSFFQALNQALAVFDGIQSLQSTLSVGSLPVFHRGLVVVLNRIPLDPVSLSLYRIFEVLEVGNAEAAICRLFDELVNGITDFVGVVVVSLRLPYPVDFGVECRCHAISFGILLEVIFRFRSPSTNLPFQASELIVSEGGRVGGRKHG